jgi:S1-C subfamily serine protease
MSGVAVVGVNADSPAALAEIRSGDVIVAVDGRDVKGESDLARLISERRPGDQVSLTILRGADRLEIAVVLKEAPLR